MFDSIKKNTIDEWREGHDPKNQFPMLLPSKGFTILLMVLQALVLV